MSFNIAFDKENNLELFLFNKITYENNYLISNMFHEPQVARLGTLLLLFLNTNFENDNECAAFISRFCFPELYLNKYPNREFNHSIIKIKLTKEEFYKELKYFVKKEKDDFLFLKHTLLKNLNLPYNESFIEDDDEISDEEFLKKNPKTKEFLNEVHEYLDKRAKEAKEYRKKYDDIKENYPLIYEMYFNKNNKRILKKEKETSYDSIEINSFLNHISIDFNLIPFIFSGINPYKYNIPYAFYTDDIISIICLEFKELQNSKHTIVRQCQNCGSYFIPQNLKETKYCEWFDEKTDKLCSEAGKELAFKKSLESDNVLDLYRKRYRSLSSSVSHYGTDKAIKRFEKYKAEGSIMRIKYQNKDISAEEFITWINNTKKQDFLQS